MIARCLAALVFLAVSVPADAQVPTPRIRPEPLNFSQYLSDADFQRFREGLDAADDEEWARVRALRLELTDTAARDILLWRIALNDARATFLELDLALSELDNWPRDSFIRSEAESKIDSSGLTAPFIVNWFEENPPTTGRGRVSFGEALIAVGRTTEGEELLRETWRSGRLASSVQSDTYQRHSDLFTEDDHMARIDYLIWSNQRSLARRVLPLLSGNNRNLADARLRLAGRQQVAGDHRQVVEDAEAGREVVVGVVGAAGQVAGQAVPQGQLGGQQRAAHRAYGAPGQGLAPGQAEAALVLARQLAAHIARDIGRAVGQGQHFGRAELGAQQLGVRDQAAGHQVVAQQAELLHGEAVPGREGRAVVVVVDQRQAHTIGLFQAASEYGGAARPDSSGGPMPAPIELHTPRLLLRPWRDADRAPFAEMNGDPQVMRHFPAPLSREESDGLAERLAVDFAEHGFGFWALQRKDSGAFIGFTGLRPVTFAAPFCPAVEIAWRLGRAHWRQGLASEAARAALACGFTQLALEQIVSFTTRDNLASQGVMQAIGMRHDPAGDFDHPALAEGHRLRRHVLYRLSRADWEAGR